MNLNNPLVSVIIPTYNRPALVERAVESVLVQTYPNVEIIVIDDASEMNLEKLREKYQGVKFLRNETNRGPCFSRNRGIELAAGEYINFLDDDDTIESDKIALQVACFHENRDRNLGMVTAHAFDERSGKSIVRRNEVRGNMYEKLLYKFVVSGIETTLFKKSVLQQTGGFDEKLESSQEYDLLIRASENYTFDYVDKILSKEYRSEGQISVNFDKKINGANYLFKKHNHRYKEQGKIFWWRIQFKKAVLLSRFYAGKWFGEKFYRFLLFENRNNLSF